MSDPQDIIAKVRADLAHHMAAREERERREREEETAMVARLAAAEAEERERAAERARAKEAARAEAAARVEALRREVEEAAWAEAARAEAAKKEAEKMAEKLEGDNVRVGDPEEAAKLHEQRQRRKQSGVEVVIGELFSVRDSWLTAG